MIKSLQSSKHVNTLISKITIRKYNLKFPFIIIKNQNIRNTMYEKYSGPIEIKLSSPNKRKFFRKWRTYLHLFIQE